MRQDAMRQVIVFFSLGSLLLAQNPPASSSSSTKRETIAKPMTEKERKKNEARLKKELETPYKKWLNEEVGYIITDEERKAFKAMATDDERQTFIENFWLRRDPTPDTEENEYREEHYRRIAYANDRFASGILVGKPIAAASISNTVRRTRSIRIPRAEPMNAPTKKAAAAPRRILSNNGAIVISTESAPTLNWNSWIRRCPANIA